MNSGLIKKYNVPGPRYTSYPTVPYWNSDLAIEAWKDEVSETFRHTNHAEGISLYVHLPFCESLCTYCGCNKRITVNHKVEDPYIKAVLKEWKMYLSIFGEIPRIKEIHLGGGTPTFFAPERLRQLVEGLLESAVVTETPSFSFEAHPNSTSEDHLKTLASLGFTRISVGVQDFDPRVQEIVNRIQSFDTVQRVTEAARTFGYTSVNFDLIYGLPLQQLHSVESTIDKVKRLMPDRIAFYSYAHVPWIKPGQRRFTEADLPDGDEKRKLYERGRSLLEAVGYREIGMDHFALESDSLYNAMNAGTLHRNFMGYTPASTSLMIGLGVSSISDSWGAFAQNEKKVEDYYKRIASGELPFIKGHKLSREDKIMRKHILNLMCYGYTSWQDDDRKCGALYDGLDRLREPEADGLVTIEPFGVKVTETGRSFLRNICMAFDAHLWARQPQTQIFSSTV